VTVDVSKNVPFYSPDSFFSFVPPLSFFLDGHVRTIKSISKYTIADVCAY
jgi:hypothetical protein